MRPDEYQKLAGRTECDQQAAWSNMTPFRVRLNHAVIGLAGEVGELAAAVEHCLYYGQVFQADNFAEELGDILWYTAQACSALGVSMEAVMQANIAKLKQRYPDKYSNERALEENRDRQREAEIIVQRVNVAVEVTEEQVEGGSITTTVERLKAEDDGVDYGEMVTYDDLTAKKIARANRWICRNCGRPVNDEVVFRVLAGKGNQGANICANCLGPLKVKDLICLK